MMKKIYAIISITLILLIINIYLTVYINTDDYYGENYLSHYYKLKNMPTIIPFEFEESDYEYNYADNDYYYPNIEETDNAPFFNYNKYNTSYKTLNYCYSLLNEFVKCLSAENEKNYKCQKLFDEKMKELEKCEMINFNNSIQNMQNNIIHFKLPFEEINYNIEEEFEDEKKFNDINEFSTLNEIKEKKEEEKMEINALSLIDENKDDKNINYSNLDCVEYGLSNDEHIICTKYE